MQQEVLILLNTWSRLMLDGIKWPSRVHMPSAEAETCFSKAFAVFQSLQILLVQKTRQRPGVTVRQKPPRFLRLCPNVITPLPLQIRIMTFMVTRAHKNTLYKENESGFSRLSPSAALTSRPRLAQGEMRRGVNVAGSFLTAELVSRLPSQFLQLFSGVADPWVIFAWIEP